MMWRPMPISRNIARESTPPNGSATRATARRRRVGVDGTWRPCPPGQRHGELQQPAVDGLTTHTKLVDSAGGHERSENRPQVATPKPRRVRSAVQVGGGG